MTRDRHDACAAPRDIVMLRQNRGFSAPSSSSCVLYLVYNFIHPRGFSASVLVQNANEAFALALVAMAQTVPVLVGGLDLSVGAVMTLVNCIASHLARRHARARSSSASSSASPPAPLAGFVNGCVVVYGRIQPIIATLATGAVYIGLALFLRPDARRRGRRGPRLGADQRRSATWPTTYRLVDDGDAAWFQPIAWLPVPLMLLVLVVRPRLGAVPPLRHRAHRLRHRLGRGRRLHVGPRHRPRQDRGLHAGRLLRRHRRPVPRHPDRVAAMPTSRRPAPTRSTRSPRWSSAAPRCSAAAGSAIGSICRRLRAARHLVQLPHLRRRPAAAAAVRGHRPARRGQPRRHPRAARQEPPRALPMRP